MTEKRFRYTDNGFVIDYQSEQKVLNLCDVVELLNMLHEENEQLKKENKVLADALTVYFQSKTKGDVE